MREVVSKVYTFDELSPSAKDTARQWFRELLQPDDYAESVLEDASRLGLMIGINLATRPVKLMGGGTRMEPNVYWAVCDRGAGASFAGSYSHAKGSVRKLAAEAPAADREGKPQKSNLEVNRIAVDLAAVQKRNFYQVQASVSHYGRDHGMNIDVERADGKPLSDADAETTEQALRDFAEWIHQSLETEYEYRMSDEIVDEDIRANEYEFDEDGRRA